MAKKQYILEKAEELFAKNGYDATTIRHIAKAAQINVAMVSYYFGSKEKLIEALFKQRMEHGYQYTTAIVNDTSINAFQKLEKIIEGYTHKVQASQKFYRVFLAEQVVNNNRKIISFMEATRKHYLKIYDQIILEGIRGKIFKYKVDPVLVAAMVSGTLMQCLLNKKFFFEYHLIDVKSADAETKYFEAIREYLKSTIKRLLGYEN